jgi:hypothetical protein
VSEKVEITDLGEIHWLLGFEIRCDRVTCTIAINQQTYLEVIAMCFRLTDAKPLYTPLEPSAILNKEQAPPVPIDAPYLEACGAILWPSIIS